MLLKIVTFVIKVINVYDVNLNLHWQFLMIMNNFVIQVQFFVLILIIMIEKSVNNVIMAIMLV